MYSHIDFMQYWKKNHNNSKGNIYLLSCYCNLYQTEEKNRHKSLI